MPAATAEPMTPATLGPIACMRDARGRQRLVRITQDDVGDS